VHEGGIATPLVVHWPEGISARGELRHDVGHCIDFLPTLLELAGAAADAPGAWGRATASPQRSGGSAGAPPPPGKSLVPAFAQSGAVARDFLFFSHGGNHALRVGNWKLVSARD
jgi:arylsulfatase